jgi:hypothetical protein
LDFGYSICKRIKAIPASSEIVELLIIGRYPPSLTDIFFPLLIIFNHFSFFIELAVAVKARYSSGKVLVEKSSFITIHRKANAGRRLDSASSSLFLGLFAGSRGQLSQDSDARLT